MAVKGEEEEEEAAYSRSLQRETPSQIWGPRVGLGYREHLGRSQLHHRHGTQRCTWVPVLDGTVPRDEGQEGCTEPQPPRAWAEAFCVAPDLQFITCMAVACSLPGLV